MILTKRIIHSLREKAMVPVYASEYLKEEDQVAVAFHNVLKVIKITIMTATTG